MKPKLGLVGLGNIREPMCRHILNRGYKVAVYDVNPEAVSRLGDTPAEPVENLETLAVGTDVVLLSLPNSDIVEEVVLGEDGMVWGLSAGKVLIDTSSSRPSSTRSIAERVETAMELEFPMPIGSALAQIWQTVLAQGYEAEGHTAIYAFLEDLLGGREGE